jgi:hypothetical protein|tara:strand:+ start:430 stop:1653 length:1224 start_codon:yes stop_codon:yes gene_type:complete
LFFIYLKFIYLKFIWFFISIGLLQASKFNFRYKKYSSKKKHTFFGYYDKSLFSDDGKKILALSVGCLNEPISDPIAADIGYFSIDNNLQFNKVGETTTWCWQMGARLMWHPFHSSGMILYNKMSGDNYGSIAYDLKKDKIINEYNFPIYDIDVKGDKVATLNFSRLGRLRPGYGYINIPDDNVNDPAPKNDGVWIIDVESNSRELLISLKDLSKFVSKDSMVGAEHYVNHLSFSPSGKKLMFFHIWTHNRKRNVRALVVNVDGTELQEVMEKSASHYAWKNDSELLLTGQGEDGFGYYLIDLNNSLSSTMLNSKLSFDGHPSFFIDQENIIFDSYPRGILRKQSLFLSDLNGHMKLIAEFIPPPSYLGETRCDLHPRLSPDEKKICIDTPGKEGRYLTVFFIEDLRK